jgi:hypothetical protein
MSSAFELTFSVKVLDVVSNAESARKMSKVNEPGVVGVPDKSVPGVPVLAMLKPGGLPDPRLHV